MPFFDIRRLAMTVFALLSVMSGLVARELRITEANQAMEPMTVPMQRLDYNNEICALVKVVLPLEGVQFEGNTVGGILPKTGEYWVYLTPGTKMLKIKAPGHYPVMANFVNLGIGPLVSKGIYYLTIKPHGSDTLLPAVETNYVVLSVTPADAIVKIDGQPCQVVDGSVIVLLKLGSHTWQAEAVGYSTGNGTFKITAANKTRIDVTLKSQKANLDVTTLPDVSVYVNGQQKGIGNLALELLPGLYNVELSRKGFRSVTHTLELKPSETVKLVQSEFDPLFGILNVNYRPVGARIALDGKYVGETPANLGNVLTGTYQLSIEAPGHTAYTQEVTITETTPVSLTGSLQKNNTTVPVMLCLDNYGKEVFITMSQWQEMHVAEQTECVKGGLFMLGDNNRLKWSLDCVAKWMKDNPNDNIWIEGYADTYTGTASSNERRAIQYVRYAYDILTKEYNIESERLSTVTYAGSLFFERVSDDWNGILIRCH